MKAALFFSIALSALLLPQLGYADCVCRCVDGEMQALCNSSIEIAPICPPRVCPIMSPSIRRSTLGVQRVDSVRAGEVASPH
jgi:hypothetical protein